MNPILTALLRDGFTLAVISRNTGIKERHLRSGELTERDQARLEHYAYDKSCCKGLVEL